MQGVWVLLFLKRSASEAKWALLKAHGPSIGDLASEKYGANSPLHKIRSHMAGSTVPAGPTLNPPKPISKRRFDSSTWSFAHGLILSTILSGIKSVLQWSVGIVKRCEIDPMPCSNCLNLVDPLLSDESSSLRERLEPVFQSKSHAFE